MEPKPQREHKWLHQLVGEWAYDSEAVLESGKPPAKFSGTERVRSIGGLWVVCRGRGEMPGGSVGITVMTLGFDPAIERVVGTFIGSMMTHLWLYNGQLDDLGHVLTLDTQGPSISGEGRSARYQDIIEVKSRDERLLSSQFLAEDGSWKRFMTATYRRTG